MIGKLPLEKKVKLRDLCLQALRCNTLTIQLVASVIGTLISGLPGVEFRWLHYRNLERDKINALAQNNGNYRALMRLSEAAKQELRWWTIHIMHASWRLRHPVISYIFQTDASDLGWGVTCTPNPQLQSQGLWTSEQRTIHINVRELYVVFICLTIFCTDKSEVHIKFELDNMTAVSYINNMGGCTSFACDTVTRKIWAWCISHNIWVIANYIPGPNNVVSDSLSRKHLSDHEWQLNTNIFHKLSKKFPKFSIDLFASLLNRQVERYASWHPDPHAAIVDAFSVSWANEYFYAFPSFSLIPKCLEKISLRPSQRGYTGPCMAQTNMVPSSSKDADSATQVVVVDPSSGVTLTPIKQGPQHARQTEVDGLSIVRQHYQSQDFSDHVTGVLIASWRTSTQKQYASYLKKWNLFCRERKILAHPLL